MKYTLTYNLPDELDLYKAALKAKYDSNSSSLCPVEQSALQELHKAVTLAILHPNTENAEALHKVLAKYERYA